MLGSRLYGDDLKKTLAILLLPLTAYTSIAIAQWSTPLRISNELYGYNVRIVSNESILHIIYSSDIDRSFYQRSTDFGFTWSAPIIISEGGPGVQSIRPLIKSQSDTIVATWYYGMDPGYNIGFRKSINDGGSWGPVSIVLPSNHYWLGGYTISICGSNAFVIYADVPDSSYFYFIKSTNLGVSWSAPRQIFHLQNSQEMDLECRGDTLLLSLSARYNSNERLEEYFVRSTNGGQSWSDPMLLSTFDNYGSQEGSLTINERGDIAIVWIDWKYSPFGWTGDIFIRYSYDLGLTWTQEEAITSNNLQAYPKIVWKADSVHVVCEDYSGEIGNIGYMLSTDNGGNWGVLEQIDDNTADSWSPDLALMPGQVHVVWDDRRLPDYGIYYSRFQVDDVINDDNPIFSPTKVSLTAYPNPFNSATTITLSGAEQAEIDIYDISGRLITTLHTIGSQAHWDASPYSSGLYFARLAGEKAGTIKLVLVK
jgi:hypothetical protein